MRDSLRHVIIHPSTWGNIASVNGQVVVEVGDVLLQESFMKNIMRKHRPRIINQQHVIMQAIRY